MMTTDETVAWLLSRIGHVMDRPLMYGGTATGVDLILQHYFELLGAITHRHDDFDRVKAAVHEQQGCRLQTFASRCHELHPSAPDSDVVEHVVANWKAIAGELGLEIPSQPLAGHSQLRTS